VFMRLSGPKNTSKYLNGPSAYYSSNRVEKLSKARPRGVQNGGSIWGQQNLHKPAVRDVVFWVFGTGVGYRETVWDRSG
jgi:hypothetical protein